MLIPSSLFPCRGTRFPLMMSVVKPLWKMGWQVVASYLSNTSGRRNDTERKWSGAEILYLSTTPKLTTQETDVMDREWTEESTTTITTFHPLFKLFFILHLVFLQHLPPQTNLRVFLYTLWITKLHQNGFLSLLQTLINNRYTMPTEVCS